MEVLEETWRERLRRGLGAYRRAIQKEVHCQTKKGSAGWLSNRVVFAVVLSAPLPAPPSLSGKGSAPGTWAMPLETIGNVQLSVPTWQFHAESFCSKKDAL